MSGTMDKIKAKVDNVLHKDKTTDTTHTGTHTGAGTHTGTHTGAHGTTGVHGSDPTGPHDSHMANKADPRVDSDRYGAAGNTSGAGGIGAGQYGSNTHTTGSGLTGSHGTHTTGGGLTGNHGTTGYSDPTGPHDSHMANKADPRVDSDRYGAAGNTSGAGGIGAGQYGSNTHTTGSGLTGSHGTHTTGSGLTGSHGTHTTGSGLTGSHGTTGYSDPTGPHDSHMANKADPRVDSDRYGAAGNTSGAGGIGAGQYGSNTHAGTHTGTHGTGLTGAHGGNTVGSGNSANTAGPHNSDMLNKIDPRVDSDLDGSKTVGGNQTYR